MKDSTLKIVLFAIIIIFGSMMILFDIPIFYLLAGVVVLAILVLFLSGTIKLPSLRAGKKAGPAPARKAAPAEKEGARKKEKKPKKERKEKVPGEKSGAGGFFSSLKSAFAVLGRDFLKGKKSRKERETEERKIDALLDRSIRGGDVVSLDDIIPDAAPAEKKKATDPFTALVGEDLNADLLNDIQGAEDFTIPDDSDLGIGIGSPGETVPDAQGDAANMDISLAGDEAPIILDETNDADEVREILESHSGEIDLGKEGDIDLAGEAIDGLDGLNLDGIDLGEADDLQEGQSGIPKPLPVPGAKSAVSQPGTPPGKAEPPKPAAPAFSPEQDMLSFSKGRGQDDDLMASLKSDARSAKKSDYASLIRDMKDTRVDASDLRSELESLLKPKKPKTE